MSFGAKYASVYDALYGDKDYPTEARFVLDQIRSVVPPGPLHILDLGCGTGQHAALLARSKISVTGVDQSAEMLAIAVKRRESLPEDLRAHLRFRVGDIRALDFHNRYDAVVSLFHVISYVIKNHDLDATIQVARRHLNVGGAFLFDFWYGPAVLRNRPQSRVKTTQLGDSHIRRSSIPEWDRERGLVLLNYDIEIENILSGRRTSEREQHSVRYFFSDEIESRLAAFGFEVIRFGEWLTGNPPSESTFSVYALAKAK